MFEFLLPQPNECANCRGEGFIIVENNGVECAYCKNLGGRKMSPHMRSDLAGIAYTSWRDGWGMRYEAVYLTMQGWHSRALTYLSTMLKEGRSVV